MSKTKHTPGPWEILRDAPDSQRQILIVSNHDTADGEDAWRVASVVNHCGEPPAEEANAHLMAAAPEMFDALSLCADVLEEARDCYLVNGKRPKGGSEAAPNSEWAALVRAIKATRAALASALDLQPATEPQPTNDTRDESERKGAKLRAEREAQ